MTNRDETQRIVVEWGARCFGAEHMADKIVRAARFIEEAVELVQAVGLPKDHAQRALDYVYSRDPGDPAQELGGVSNTQYALAGALGLSVAECEAREIARCLSKSPEHFAQRNRDKLEKIDAVQAAEYSKETEMLAGEMKLPKMDGKEVSPGVWLVGEPSPIPGTDKLRCLAQVGNALALVELRLKFSHES